MMLSQGRALRFGASTLAAALACGCAGDLALDDADVAADTHALAADAPPSLTKGFVRDLLPDLMAPGGSVYEKIEGLAVTRDRRVLIVNDNDGVDDNSGETQLLDLGRALDGGAPPRARFSLRQSFVRQSTYPVCLQDSLSCDSDDETVAEIAAVSRDGMTLVYTDAAQNRVGFVDIADPEAPVGLGTVDLLGEPTSVAVVRGYVVVAVNTSPDFLNTSGHLAVIPMRWPKVVHRIDLGGQPDSVSASPDGRFIAVAIENERDEDLGDGELPQLPAGNLVIIRSGSWWARWWHQARYSPVDLTGLAAYGGDDPEPEYVDINDRNIAVVTLQENNHLVLVDVETGAIVNDFDAGAVDLTQVDTEEEDPALISLTGELFDVPREPDGVTWIDDRRFATADEGDLFGGSRGFTIFNTSGGIEYTSGNRLDHLAVRLGHYPDSRSGNKGNEPENVEYARFSGREFLFVASERSSLIFVYDVRRPRRPRLVQVLPTAAAPEGVLAIPQRNLLIVASEEDNRGDKLRAALNVYSYEPYRAPAYPTLVSTNRADRTPIPWGAISGLVADPHRKDRIYAVDDSFYQRSRIFTIDTSRSPARIVRESFLRDDRGVFASLPVVALADPTVPSDHPSRADVFDEADLAALINEDGTVNIDGEGIAVAADGGFWVVSEGNGTFDDDGRPINSRNFLLKTSAKGSIEQVVLLPEELNAVQLRFGFEGVTVYDGKVYVAFQRAWNGEPNPRIGQYDPATGEWGFAFYPLDPRESQRGGWVGLSDITSLGNGDFLVIERDNQGGPDAAIKRLYRFSIHDLEFR